MKSLEEILWTWEFNLSDSTFFQKKEMPHHRKQVSCYRILENFKVPLTVSICRCAVNYCILKKIIYEPSSSGKFQFYSGILATKDTIEKKVENEKARQSFKLAWTVT